MTGYQIIQLSGALVAGISIYFLAQIVLKLSALPAQPEITERKQEKNDEAV